MGKKVGLNCELSINTGTFGVPVWDPVDDAKDVTLNLEAGEADASSRGSLGWRETLQTLRDAGIDFEMVHDPEDADFDLFRLAFFNGTTVDVQALDGGNAASGSEGLRIIAMVTSFQRAEPLEDTVMLSVSLKPTPNPDSVPTWVVVP